jgi:hypothetical protein
MGQPNIQPPGYCSGHHADIAAATRTLAREVPDFALMFVVALYFGRQVLLPIALAVLLSFVLAPPVRLLQRLYLPRFAAVTIVQRLARAAEVIERMAECLLLALYGRSTRADECLLLG